jgi:penicillin-binding protein 1A
LTVPKAPPKRKSRNRANRPKPARKWLVLLLLVPFFALGLLFVGYALWASTFDVEAVKEMPSRSTVYDMDGKVYSRLQGENRLVVPLKKVSSHFVDALLAREDARFYSHRGLDPIGVVRAIIRNLTSGSAQQGASTLTQQLARNSFPERIGARKSIHRKLLEAFVANRIEQRYTKEEILEHYMNRIYFGAGVYGIEAASLTYFGKHAENLSLGEAAMIAGIIRAPTYSSSQQHPERAIKARDAVLDRMVKSGKITQGAADEARAKKLVVLKKRPVQAQENYAMDAVVRDLNMLLTDEQRSEGGLKIYTTIDPILQRAAETSVDKQLRKVETRSGYSHPKRAQFSAADRDEEAPTPYLQGSAVVIDNKTGGIRALVGGRDYAESKYNRALMANRQVGSTFKPFVYAAAYGRGLLPGTSIDDGPIQRGEIRLASNWTPSNSDGSFKGPMRAEEGLIQSRNTMSVRVGEQAGLDEIVRIAKLSGIDEVPRQPAIYLGAFEGTLLGITSAYSVFPNHGTRKQSYIIERIDDASGQVIYRAAHVQNRAIDPGVSWLTTAALVKAMEKGTGSSARAMGWTKPSAGKTGTTNDYKDAWFVGYTSHLTCGVWVGLDQPETIVQRGYGAALALPIWAEVMSAAPSARYPAAQLKPSIPLQRVTVCAISGQMAMGGCARGNHEYNADLPSSCIPRSGCEIHRGGVLVNSDRRTERDRRRSDVPGNIFRSFRRFFGGE